MDTFLSIEVRAAQIPDSVRKLKFLRRELALPQQVRRLPVASVAATVIAALAFVLNGSNTRAPAAVEVEAVAVENARKASPAPASSELHGKIWLVEKTPAYWVYSNGLQIRTEYLTESTIRHYLTWSRADLVPDIAESTFPAGIVFHTTESLMLPLEPDQAHSLVRTREATLDHIRKGRLYNYVIDRFGQVFRVVPDDEVAYHAGHSVWADDHNVYEGLNDSFLGVAFEARTDTSFVPEPAQIRSGRMLTDLLRRQFSIPESNCVTHAQVSVNPTNMQIGYHTDWAANFPFAEFGLGDGYAIPLPAIELFGFNYNQYFLDAIGGKPWEGLLSAERRLSTAAELQNISTATYKGRLQLQYQAIRSYKHEPADRDRT